MILDATTKKLEILLGGAPGTQLPFVCSWVDQTASGFTSGENDGATNGVTAVDLVPPPGASTQRALRTINIWNADAAAAAVTIRMNNNATTRILCTVTLQPGYFLEWAPDGFKVLDAIGRILFQSGYTSYALKSWTLLTAASGTYTTPAGVRALDVQGWAPGGGGGGASYSVASNAAVGGGGACGGYSRKFIPGPAASYAYACPAGGTAGANTGGTGGTGGDTTFGAVLTAKGGLGGVGQTFGTALAAVLGGDGAAAGGVGDFTEYGAPGGYAVRLSGTVAVSGAGGSSAMGKGGNSRITNGAGNNGSGYGSGGGGACALSSSQAGGVGGPGCILVTEYY